MEKNWVRTVRTVLRCRRKKIGRPVPAWKAEPRGAREPFNEPGVRLGLSIGGTHIRADGPPIFHEERCCRHRSSINLAETNQSRRPHLVKVAAAGISGYLDRCIDQSGVESVTITGEDKNLLLVIGVGIDSNRITEKLCRKVGHAEVVELRTVVDAADDLIGGGGLVVTGDHAYCYQPC
ncbi:unnamed protein product [Urochloa humidicola]